MYGTAPLVMPQGIPPVMPQGVPLVLPQGVGVPPPVTVMPHSVGVAPPATPAPVAMRAVEPLKLVRMMIFTGLATRMVAITVLLLKINSISLVTCRLVPWHS
jgi:hypothetical protein